MERSVQCVHPLLEMEASKEEQRGVVRFLVAEGTVTPGIHRRMSAVYGEHFMSLTSVDEWQKRIREGRTSLQDDSRPGQIHRAITPDVIARIDGLIRENRRIKEEQICVQVGRGSASMGEVVNPSATSSFYKTAIDRLVSQWINVLTLLTISSEENKFHWHFVADVRFSFDCPL